MNGLKSITIITVEHERQLQIFHLLHKTYYIPTPHKILFNRSESRYIVTVTTLNDI